MTVNEMIVEAITTDSRKRKARHQSELEALGYKVVKDGGWYIRNPKTDRFIELSYHESSIRTTNRYIKFGRVWSRKNGYVNKPISVIDFENLLNTPISERNIWKDNRTHAEIMRGCLHDRKYHNNHLNNAMAEYQQKIDNITTEYQRMLKNAKDNYDWNIKYHTEALETANKKIAELLHKTA